MAKKNYYYVLVCTSYGAIFVTGTLPKHNAVWDKEKPPMQFSKAMAEDVALGLTLNGYNAYMVTTQWELISQPYLYKQGEFKWVENFENAIDV